MAVDIKPALGVREKLKQARLYAITLPPIEGQTYPQMVEAACKGGADIVQLRDKGLSDSETLQLARELKAVCARYGALFIVNNRLDAALISGADGVHLGQDDLPLKEARGIAQAYLSAKGERGRVFFIGCSTHSLEQALKAEADGADYLGCGPVFATPTKPDYPAVGLNLVKQYKDKVRIPFAAIGGIGPDNAAKVAKAGASCIAVVRSVFGAEDIEKAARELRKKSGAETK